MQRRPPKPPPVPEPSPPEGSALLTTIDVARLLRVHPKQVYRLFARGLPRHRVGGEWRFDRASVLRWSAGKDAPAPESGGAAPLPLLASNGDAAVLLLLRHVRAMSGTLIGNVEADRESGLELLKSRRVLATGYHGTTFPRHVADGRLARLHLVRREVGLVGRPGRAPRLDDLATMRLASRPLSAGVRQTLDRRLSKAGLDATALHARAHLYASHLEVVHAVASDRADVGIATHAWAHRLGLPFLALDAEDYGILLLTDDLGRLDVVHLCEAAQDVGFRHFLAAEAGYDATDSGALRFDAEQAPATPANAEPTPGAKVRAAAGAAATVKPRPKRPRT